MNRISAIALACLLSACNMATTIRHQNGVAAVATVGHLKDVKVLADGSVTVAEIGSPLESLLRTLNLGMFALPFGL